MSEEEGMLDEEVDESESSDSTSKLRREYNKRKKQIAKTKKVVRNKLIAKAQILIIVLIIIVVLSWNKIENVLFFLGGQEEVTIVNKAINGGCLQIDTNKESYCVDQPSYDLAVIGNKYLVVKTKYLHRLREVPSQWISGNGSH